MKLSTAIALFSTISAANGFTFVPKAPVSHTSLNEKINNMIDLESPKVVHNEQLCTGDKKVMCRCWKSGTFPACDASHVAHNKETGDNVGPLIVSVPKEE